MCLACSSVWLLLLDEFSIQRMLKYASIGVILLMMNRSRSLAKSDAHLILVGGIIFVSGLISLVFHWPLAFEICLLGSVFILIGYSAFVTQLTDAGVFEYLSIAFLLVGLFYFVLKVLSWSGSDMLEILGIYLLFILFTVQGFKKPVPTSTSEFPKSNRENALV